MKNRQNKILNKGFTLIELLVVVAIITLLSGVVMASVAEARNKANNTKQLADYRSIVAALIQFKQDKGYYPASSTKACFGIYSSGGCLDAGTVKIPDATINSDMQKYLSSYDFIDKPSLVVNTDLGFIKNYSGFMFKCNGTNIQYGSCKNMLILFPAIKNSKSCPTILSDIQTNEVFNATGYTICSISIQ